MMLSRLFALVTVTSLALACAPAVWGATAVMPAKALHTSVHPRSRIHHHRRSHRAHHIRAELRSVPARSWSGGAAPSRRAPSRRPARSHATLPHSAAKLHRSDSRGGAPYALGHASLSLSLWTGGESIPAAHNDLVSNPSSGILKGRSPPRGDPLAATRLPFSERATLLRAPTDPLRNPSPTTSRDHHSPPAEACSISAARTRGCVVPQFTVSRITPDRASEGGPAGTHLPSWRCFT